MRQANQNNLYCHPPPNLFKNNYLFSVLRNHSGIVDNPTVGLFCFIMKDINKKYIIKIKGGKPEHSGLSLLNSPWRV